jgi:5'-nucleotidase
MNKNHLRSILWILPALLLASIATCPVFGAATTSPAAESRLLMLFTNDIHDHLRPGRDGVGGLPYVAGHIAAVRAKRGDVLLVDSGDWLEKGDLVAHVTHGELTYEMAARMRYDGITLGNHDHDQGLERMRRYEAILGQEFLCLNGVDESGQTRFARHRVVTVGDVRIGLIGLIVPQDEGTLDFAASARRLGEEAAMLKPKVHLVVALVHHASRACIELAKQAPDVDVFLSGHAHEYLHEPVISPETGALIVQAGAYARAVGHLDLAIDLATGSRRVVDHRLVMMDHSTIEPDREMLAIVQRREAELCPEASEFVTDNPKQLGVEMAWLAAEAMRHDEGVEIGFCHPGHILRHYLPPGRIDLNAVFLTGGQRAAETVRATLTGAEILAYIEAMDLRKDPTAWSGVSLVADSGAPQVDPARTYRVVMPKIEWERRFMREVNRSRGQGPLGTGSFAVQPATTSYTGALRAWFHREPEPRDLAAWADAVRRSSRGP